MNPRQIGYLLLTAATTVAAGPVRHGHAAAASGMALWHSVRVGMTEAQVRAVLTGLEKNDKNDDFHAPATDVAGHLFGVGIEMIDGRVRRVSLSSDKTLPDDIEGALTTKYGAPANPYRCAARAFYSCEGTWKAPAGVQITLAFLIVPNGGGSVTSIRYEAPNVSGL